MHSPSAMKKVQGMRESAPHLSQPSERFPHRAWFGNRAQRGEGCESTRQEHQADALFGSVGNGVWGARGSSGGRPCAPLPAVSSAPSAAPAGPPPQHSPPRRRSCRAARRGLSSVQWYGGALRIVLAMRSCQIFRYCH